jgi:glutamate--cysteine ligase catalytic subunit
MSGIFDGFCLTSFRDSTLPIFHPEFGRFMLEATPGKPWSIGFKDLLDVEPNMRLRYVFTKPVVVYL